MGTTLATKQDVDLLRQAIKRRSCDWRVAPLDLIGAARAWRVRDRPAQIFASRCTVSGNRCTSRISKAA